MNSIFPPILSLSLPFFWQRAFRFLARQKSEFLSGWSTVPERIACSQFYLWLRGQSIWRIKSHIFIGLVLSPKSLSFFSIRSIHSNSPYRRSNTELHAISLSSLAPIIPLLRFHIFPKVLSPSNLKFYAKIIRSSNFESKNFSPPPSLPIFDLSSPSIFAIRILPAEVPRKWKSPLRETRGQGGEGGVAVDRVAARRGGGGGRGRGGESSVT